MNRLELLGLLSFSGSFQIECWRSIYSSALTPTWCLQMPILHYFLQSSFGFQVDSLGCTFAECMFVRIWLGLVHEVLIYHTIFSFGLYLGQVINSKCHSTSSYRLKIQQTIFPPCYGNEMEEQNIFIIIEMYRWTL
jgi:hypothetical protein